MTELEDLVPGWFYINAENTQLPVKETNVMLRKTYREIIASNLYDLK